MATVADAVDRGGIVIVPAKEWEVQDKVREAGCRVAIFAPDSNVTRRDRKVARAVALVCDGRIVIDWRGERTTMDAIRGRRAGRRAGRGRASGIHAERASAAAPPRRRNRVARLTIAPRLLRGSSRFAPRSTRATRWRIPPTIRAGTLVLIGGACTPTATRSAHSSSSPARARAGRSSASRLHRVMCGEARNHWQADFADRRRGRRRDPDHRRRAMMRMNRDIAKMIVQGARNLPRRRRSGEADHDAERNAGRRRDLGQLRQRRSRLRNERGRGRADRADARRQRSRRGRQSRRAVHRARASVCSASRR